MFKKSIITITILTALVCLTSCASPKLTPYATAEPTIPSNFTTYLVEGLFSLSYPPDWISDTSIKDEFLAGFKEYLKSITGNSLEGVTTLFLGGLSSERNYNPRLTIMVNPFVGDWSLDDLVEAELQNNKQYASQYLEFSRQKTIVNGRESVIVDMEALAAGLDKKVRSLQLFQVKDKFLWLATCATYSSDYKTHEKTFYQVVNSLRILD
jgi:hypothetical protein